MGQRPGEAQLSADAPEHEGLPPLLTGTPHREHRVTQRHPALHRSAAMNVHLLVAIAPAVLSRGFRRAGQQRRLLHHGGTIPSAATPPTTTASPSAPPATSQRALLRAYLTGEPWQPPL
ncbi:hypothetical protein EMIT051CA3_80052 [Pseudomonas chlororaphis]